MPKKISTKEFRNTLAEEDYILLSDRYINTYSKIYLQCPKGHKYTATRNSWRNGRRCFQCYKENNSGENASAWKGGVVQRNIPLYDTYHKKISFCEETRRCPEETILLQVRCKYCKEWFTPTRNQVENRLYALNRAPENSAAENNFYCSDNCKAQCPLYKKICNYDGKPPKKIKPYTAQELYTWSVEVRKRANFKCEICSSEADESHHIIPKSIEPFFALDQENGISVCKNCHHRLLHTGECSASKLLANFCGSKQ